MTNVKQRKSLFGDYIDQLNDGEFKVIKKGNSIYIVVEDASLIDGDIELQRIKDTKKNRKKKQSGRKTEVYPYEIGDAKKMTEYYYNNGMWLHYMMFVLSINLARRIGDMLSLKWENFFDPKTGNFRKDILEIREDKTDKLANPRINSACRDAICLYIEKTGCDIAKNNYTTPVFMQLTGTHKGSVLSRSGYWGSLKKAATAVGIEYNIGTHSARKFFGMMNRMLHPGDRDSMELLRSIYNHSSTKTTEAYIGLTKQKINAYYDDMGCFFRDYIIEGKEYKDVSDRPIVSLDTNDLRDIIRVAYESGIASAQSDNAMDHVDNINTIMQMIEDLAK